VQLRIGPYLGLLLALDVELHGGTLGLAAVLMVMVAVLVVVPVVKRRPLALLHRLNPRLCSAHAQAMHILLSTRTRNQKQKKTTKELTASSKNGYFYSGNPIGSRGARTADT
jgi:hypothetical protein